ncbi:hypothetical protein GV794_01195 [Nocardia cyriacigeorgica]|uniref:Uncharacterized protein n=1 Tax=Nocardia cyriacigeorgica TaxID=135487 RepID=A0A6P1D3H1_9NOCA|nr:hypothetical protein [Nocardia cyriacigeorgica]NEW40643.1 hypothetical protein [Nocardia cyriacigeorgica]NEW45116.1 hypothetical protein [Nocardia cyriacigeorgica]NEW51129.1 hypothetical protein [Nocardia cyriacigeorgica]NEW54288.1 hypothetical protein [Nocardia cyriacigeorgica]
MCDLGHAADPEGIVAGRDNKTPRAIAVYARETMNAPARHAMFEQISVNNQAGGWRKLEGSRRSGPWVGAMEGRGENPRQGGPMSVRAGCSAAV